MPPNASVAGLLSNSAVVQAALHWSSVEYWK
jgi:hypothetical protein